jgi:hypothetical protein
MKNTIGAVFILSSLLACSSSDGGSGGSGGSSATSGGTKTANGGTPAKGGTSGGGTPSVNGGAPAPTGGMGNVAGGGSPPAGTGGSNVGGGAGGSTPMGGTSAGSPASGGSSAGTAGASGGSSGGSGGSGGSAFSQCPYMKGELPDPLPKNYTAGTVTVFNDDGAWTWYSDERAVVDPVGGKLIISSDANGGSRNGGIDVVVYDLATKMGKRTQVGKLAPDDHNTGAVLVKPDGKYLIAWAGHNENCNTYWSNHNGTDWEPQKTFAWNSLGCPTSSGRSVTYNNVWNMTAENKIYNFVRSVDTSPNILVSTDSGASWNYGGRLTFSPTVGYVAGYYKYWGNGVDRIDFLGTEAHPRDSDTSLYHGYVKGGKSYNSADEVKDENITDKMGPDVTAFTRIFAKGTTLGGERFEHMWNSDIVRYDDGTVAAIGMGRTQSDGNNPDHSYVYLRFSGGMWKATNIGKAGKKLYDSEQDYVGLGALHPDDPNVIYISTPFDPRGGTQMSRREIFKGITCDEGATFDWEPITYNSSVDNLRPIVPKWDNKSMVLLWFRGTYQTAQIYDEEVVGIITQN